ncbi:unnamed protein product [Brassica oleracea var. botrytis]
MSHIVTIVYRKRKRKRRYSFFPWKVKSRRFPLRTIPPFRQYVADANVICLTSGADIHTSAWL